MCVYITYTHGRPGSELVLHRQITLLHVRIPEIRNEDVNRLAPGCCQRGREPIRICDRGIVVMEGLPGQKEELPGNSVRDQSVGNIQQVFLNKKYSERPANYSVAFRVHGIGKT